MPSSGQNGLSRLVSWTSLPSTSQLGRRRRWNGQLVICARFRSAYEYRSLIGGSSAGAAPWRTAPATATYASSSPARTQRSSRPPRLMSPRPTKSIGKAQALAEDFGQHVDVFRRRDAAEQHDLAVGTDLLGERARARDAAACGSADRWRRCRPPAKARMRRAVTARLDRPKARGRRDHERAAAGTSAAPAPAAARTPARRRACP